MKEFKSITEMRKYYDNNKIYSQNGQDYFVAEFFDFKKNGVFIDIGANDGIRLSNTYYLEKDLNWTGICIEAIPKTFEKLNKNRSCNKIQIGISDTEKTETFVYIEPSSMMLSGIKKDYHPNHIERIDKQIKENSSKLIEVEIECTKIENILEKFSIFEIDYMNIDTEGSEFNIIKTIDFERFKIELMTVENNYKIQEQRKYLEDNGYEFIGLLGGDEVFRRKKIR